MSAADTGVNDAVTARGCVMDTDTGFVVPDASPDQALKTNPVAACAVNWTMVPAV
jgi:hypothetical protein